MSQKPILIDSLYVHTGGGRVLLDYLISNLAKKHCHFALLKDVRCGSLNEEQYAAEVFVLSASVINRCNFYMQHRDDYSVVLCFANVPPPIKLNCIVYTYFHNVNLLDIPKSYSLISKFVIWIKQKYIHLHKNNVTKWIVQTPHTNVLLRHYIGNVDVLEYPFYSIADKMKSYPIAERNDYILVGNYYWGTKGHDILLSAWEKLYKCGVKRRLHLTISHDNVDVCKRIESMRANGIDIVNYGNISFDKVVKLYNYCKATIYPSINESLGLGMIEAIYAGCDVIASDLPYAHDVCSPSEVFNPLDVSSLVQAVLKYEKGKSSRTVLHIDNKIDDFVSLLCDCKVRCKD